MRRLTAYLFTRIDNSALIVFRVFFGFLITLQAWGEIVTGKGRKIFVDPDFTFNFIGFDFLQTFPGTGPQMYAWMVVMGIFGVMIMLGYKYRLAIIGYAIMWSTTYFMQKSGYNNHYYLMMLLLWIMAIFPANTSFSIDAKHNPSIRDLSMPRWVTVFIIAQLWVVYTYASVAKFYPDWLDATVPQILMYSRKDYWLVGDLLQERFIHYIIAYVGILFDGLIIPLLLWKRTRKWAFRISIFFHLFNSIVFQIGIFPYLSLAFTVFFYDPKYIHKIFLSKWKAFYNPTSAPAFSLENRKLERQDDKIPTYANGLLIFFMVYFIIQIALPVRQYFIEDNVLWTEEAHRLSWRMMLRTKTGSITFVIEDKQTCKRTIVQLDDYLSKTQQRNVRTKPDMIWQFAQRLKREQEALGNDVAIYANCRVRINGRPSKSLIDPEVDLGSVDWDWWNHNEWILPSEDYLQKKSPSIEKFRERKERAKKAKKSDEIEQAKAPIEIQED